MWLRPFEVLVTSSRTALIEMIPDTLSIHALKSRSPASMSLRSHFHAKFVQVGDFFGFWSMMAFLVILTVGFLYEWRKGALDWN